MTLQRWRSLICVMLVTLTGAFTALAGPGASQPTGAQLTPKERAKRANVPEGAWIWVDVHQKSLTLYEGTEVVKRYTIATGAGSTPTPIGVFTVSHRFAGDLGGFGTRFLGLNVPWGQFGIHGTNKPGSIGHNASHGCIRMLVRDSEELYGKVPNGAKVVISAGPYGQLDSSLRTLRTGDRNSHVAAVQRRLQALGYHSGSADGIFGQGTLASVRRVREALGLPKGDTVDYAMYRAIGLILFE